MTTIADHAKDVKEHGLRAVLAEATDGPRWRARQRVRQALWNSLLRLEGDPADAGAYDGIVACRCTCVCSPVGLTRGCWCDANCECEGGYLAALGVIRQAAGSIRTMGEVTAIASPPRLRWGAFWPARGRLRCRGPHGSVGVLSGSRGVASRSRGGPSAAPGA